VQPKQFFRLLQKYIIGTGLGYVGLVVRAAHPIAASVFLHYKRTAIYKYSASDPDELSSRPNEMMLYHAIHLACLEDCDAFDFGVTDRDQEGLCRFKRKFGAEENDAFQVVFSGSGPRRTGGMLQKLAAPVIRRSPTFVCRILGRALYRYSQ
jgi:CelD/BcsL family acetyltransferase involved in cellulose biosynthesis